MNCNLLEKLGLFRGVCADQVLKKKRLKRFTQRCFQRKMSADQVLKKKRLKRDRSRPRHQRLCRSGAEEEAIETFRVYREVLSFRADQVLKKKRLKL